jgi:hypothetical protein
MSIIRRRKLKILLILHPVYNDATDILVEK